MSGATRVLGIAAVAAAATAATIGAAPEQRTSTPDVGVLDEHPAIQYAGMPTRDRVSLLDRAIREGTASLEFRGAGGYLEATLDALKISPESQLLVFSKTGVQRAATA